MSENKSVRRTNTSSSLTTREGGILLNLLAKLHASPPPAGQKLDKAATSRAFGVVATFIDASLSEARESLKELRKSAAVKDADESVVKAASQAEASLKRMEVFYKNAHLGEIKTLSDKAKAEAERAAARKAERAAKAAAKAPKAAKTKKTDAVVVENVVTQESEQLATA